MPVRPRGDILWLDFYFRDKRYRQSTGLNDSRQNRRLAEDWDATIRREIALGIFQPSNHFPDLVDDKRADRPKTFREVAEEWLSSHQRSWAEWTYRKFKGNLESRVFSKIGDLPISEITPKQLRQVREQIIAEGKLDGSKLTNRSVNRIMQPVTAIFNELFGDGEIESNPASRVTRLKEKRIAEIDPFSDEEVKALS